MNDVENLLLRVLLLEQRQGYQDRAMIGGLSAFSQNLHRQAPAGSRLPDVALLLVNYGREDKVSRAESVDEAIQLLDQADSSRNKTSEPNGVGASTREALGKVPEPDRHSQDDRFPAGHSPPPRGAPAQPGPTPRRRRLHRDRLTDLSLDAQVSDLKGVGEKAASSLSRLGVATVRDLLYLFPRDHIDYRRRDRIAEVRAGTRTTLVGDIESVRTRRVRRGLTITTAVLADEHGRIPVRWFNQPYLEKALRPGRQIAVSGEAEIFEGYLSFVPRDYEWLDHEDLTHAGRLVPIYPLTQGLSQKPLRTLMHEVVEAGAKAIVDYLPDSVRANSQLLRLPEAVRQKHFPENQDMLAAAHRRLAFDEILSIQLGLQLRRREWRQSGHAAALRISDQERQQFLDALPFDVTNAQAQVLHEVRLSLESEEPMSRLVQGDVGSGKTVIAAFALYVAALRGFQSAIMAPTEILAQQHHASLSRWLSSLGLTPQLLLGSSTARERGRLLQALASGASQILVGTHTLFQESVEFNNLAVAIVDEQHRFGVQQRARLRQKGMSPHLLAMTATPIPRTLALTVYGDLDLSVLDELPPGRLAPETRVSVDVEEAYRLVGREIAAGRQAFVVCPAIEEGSEAGVRSAVAEHRRLQHDVFPQLKVGLLHGRMTAKDKDCVLTQFRDAKLDILVATSVIEVGIDIPNATVMVVRDARQFGLAQLHQLRGRIGRGGETSYCILIGDKDEGPGRDRLTAVARSTDGFMLAEEDLRQRGPGEFWGTRQSGIPQLRVAGPGDVQIIPLASKAADSILAADPDLSAHSNSELRTHLSRFWATEVDLN